MTDNATQETQDDALVRAITLQMEVDELKANLQQLKKDSQQAQKARDKAKHEAEQLRTRNAKLSDKLDAAKKDAKQAKHLAREELQKAQAKQEAKRGKAANAGTSEATASVASDDGTVTVSLVKDQVCVAQPPHFVISSTPLSESEQHQLEFCSLIASLRDGEYGDFIDQSTQAMATRWRQQQQCLRVEDLELPTKVVTTLSENGLVMASDIQARHAAGTLSDIKGIGPAAVEQVATALDSVS
ncbi:hypothetical protein [Halomonas sp. YLGW01]|uniref:hypothetical protein n=1 Tax=Halomonas sp. YLGW01 TaxID=2773308 RepID=UPI00178292C0|nr:hypothetical protein [Halomonas sp. YLGW01]